MTRIEKWGVVAVGAFLVLLLSQFYFRTTALKHLDSVFLFESTVSVSEGGSPVSRTVASWPDALKTFILPPAEVCRSALKRDDMQPYNVLDSHAYLALYPVSLIVALFGPELGFAVLNALAHVLLLIVPYVFLRRAGIGRLPCLAFVACVALYPGWSYSAMGDYYLDRLYMPLALVGLYYAHRLFVEKPGETNTFALAGLVLASLAAAMFTERAAIMMLGMLAFYMAFFNRHQQLSPLVRNVVPVVIVAIGIYVFIYFKYIFVGFEGGGSIAGNAIATMRSPLARLGTPQMLPFLLVNAAFLGVFAFFAGTRYLVLLVGALLPNLLISTGGAELNGWDTHYHAMYIPFLVFVSSVGYAKLFRRPKGALGRTAMSLGVLAYAVSVVALLNPGTGQMDKPAFASFKNGVLAKLYAFNLQPLTSWERTTSEAALTLDSIVPRGIKVSAIEGVMPVLYRARDVSYYPIGMDAADYLVVSGSATNGQAILVSGAISYLGPAEAEALNLCLGERMAMKGFKLHGSIPSIGVLIFRKGG